jgi:hypothetical protein
MKKLYVVEDKDSSKSIELCLLLSPYNEEIFLPVLHKEYWEDRKLIKVEEVEYDSPEIAVDFGMEIAGNYMDDGWELTYSIYKDERNNYLVVL